MFEHDLINPNLNRVLEFKSTAKQHDGKMASLMVQYGAQIFDSSLGVIFSALCAKNHRLLAEFLNADFSCKPRLTHALEMEGRILHRSTLFVPGIERCRSWSKCLNCRKGFFFFFLKFYFFTPLPQKGVPTMRGQLSRYNFRRRLQ